MSMGGIYASNSMAGALKVLALEAFMVSRALGFAPKRVEQGCSSISLLMTKHPARHRVRSLARDENPDQVDRIGSGLGSFRL